MYSITYQYGRLEKTILRQTLSKRSSSDFFLDKKIVLTCSQAVNVSEQTILYLNSYMKCLRTPEHRMQICNYTFISAKTNSLPITMTVSQFDRKGRSSWNTESRLGSK